MDKINKTIEDKIKEGRSYRSMEMRALDEPGYIVEGYATTFDQPYTLWEEPGFKFQEVVDSKAFNGTDMEDVIMQYDHAGRVFARKSNDTLQLRADAHGLKVRADLGGTEIGRQLYEEIKGGYTTKMSFGFIVDKDDRQVDETGNQQVITRTILHVKKLYDVSAVSLPANDATEISARTLGEGAIAEVKEELRLASERRARRESLLKRILEEN